MKNRFVIVGAGAVSAEELSISVGSDDFVCAADAGYLSLTAAGITPDLLIGDFDSMPKPEAPCEVITLPVEKNDTDTVFCVREGIRRGYRRFLLLGCLGGSRFSHSLANIQTLSLARNLGAEAVICGDGARIYILKENEKKMIPSAKDRKDTISVFSLGDTAVVSLRGFKYDAEKLLIDRSFPIGVSNHFTERDAEIFVHKGEVLVVEEKE